MRITIQPVAAIVGMVVWLHAAGAAGDAPAATESALAEAQHLFYSGQYEAAAAAALLLQAEESEALAAFELRTSALHFEIKRAIGTQRDRKRALAACDRCPALLAQFTTDTEAGIALARTRLGGAVEDEAARFFLGKLNLNHVWLHLGTLGRKTGWDQYWEARKSLDAVLARNPQHVRARVARAWIDYIVDTKLPRGTKWLLGGGNKKRALLAVREAASTEADRYIEAEADFSLWDMQVRERNIAEAVVTVQALVRDFPENQDLIRFLQNPQGNLTR